MNNKLLLQILFETDKAEDNVSAYIPELGIQVIGDTQDEARENAKDSVYAEIEKLQKKGQSLVVDMAIIEKIRSFSVMYEFNNVNGNVSAYVPALRLGVVGENLKKARLNAEELVLVEVEQLKGRGKGIPIDTAIYETLAVDFPFNYLPASK